LYRRLHRAKEFIAASFDEPITLDQMAKVACLSTNHFLRTFQQAFHQTPHQFLTHRRIEHAQRLLLQTDLPVTEICFSVGFESLALLSPLFRRRLGLSPDKFRRKKSLFPVLQPLPLKTPFSRASVKFFSEGTCRTVSHPCHSPHFCVMVCVIFLP